MVFDPDSFFGELFFILEDREKFPKLKKHNVLPITFTSFVVRRIRQNACLHSGTQNCDVWQGGKRVVPASNFRCKDCGDPGITRDNFSRMIWGATDGGAVKESDRPVVDERAMRRMLNECGPIRPDRFRSLLVNAHALRWIPGWDISALLDFSVRLEATAVVWRRVEAKIKKSAEYKKTGQLNFDPDQVDLDIGIEVGKIHRQQLRKAARRTDISLLLQEEQKKAVVGLEETALACERESFHESAVLIRAFIASAPPLPQNYHSAVDKKG